MRNEPWVWPKVGDAGMSGAGAVPLRSTQMMGQQKKKKKKSLLALLILVIICVISTVTITVIIIHTLYTVVQVLIDSCSYFPPLGSCS